MWFTCVFSGRVAVTRGKFFAGAVTVKGGNQGAPVYKANTVGKSDFTPSILLYSFRAPKIECNCSKWGIRFPNMSWKWKLK